MFEYALTEEELVKICQQRRERDIVRRDVRGVGRPDGEKPKPLDDPQLRLAIQYIESKIGEK